MMNPVRNIIWRSGCTGCAAFIGLLLFYFVSVGLVESWTHAAELMLGDLFYVGLIALGFGLQISLFTYVKLLQKMVRTRGITATAVSGTGASTVSMAACCLHHLGDILPLIGLSGTIIFFAQYRYPLMWLGIVINLFGVLMMLRMINKHRLWPRYVFSG